MRFCPLGVDASFFDQKVFEFFISGGVGFLLPPPFIVCGTICDTLGWERPEIFAQLVFLVDGNENPLFCGECVEVVFRCHLFHFVGMMNLEIKGPRVSV